MFVFYFKKIKAMTKLHFQKIKTTNDNVLALYILQITILVVTKYGTNCCGFKEAALTTLSLRTNGPINLTIEISLKHGARGPLSVKLLKKTSLMC